MSKNYKLLLIVFSLLITSGVLMAQVNKLSGVITDAATGEKLFGASVFIADLNIGSVTNTEGYYSIDNVKDGTYQVTVSYIGYLKQNKNVKITEDTKLNFSMEASSVILGETVVKGTRAVLRETPIAFTQVSGEELELKLASRDVPMELATAPSVYAHDGGGGSGDASVYVRGFGQRNIAIMVNGVPVNDMENKSVYWSNWTGIGDVMEDLQIQRGLGASPYSVNAVGGVINMTTKGIGTEQEFVKLRSEYGSDNLTKNSLSFHKKFSGNFAATGFVSYKAWDGYAVNTYAKEYTYFFAVGGIFGNHSVEFRGLGSPQEHGQRRYQQFMSNWDKWGHDYNSNVGRLHGELYNDRVNQFHKPSFNLNWNWQLNNTSTLSTVAYFSFGRGYGTTGLGAFAKFNAVDGYEDYDAVWLTNSTNIDKRYSPTLHSSLTAICNQVNNHNWYGVLSTYNTKLSEYITLYAGVDGRYYKGMHYEELRDVLGGDYWLDTKDVNNPNHLSVVGDKVGYYNDNYVRQLGGFGQLEYRGGNISTFINLSASTTGDKRHDYFLYKSDDPFNETDWQNFFGYTAKTGINYNLDEYNNVFANIGYFSTAPMANTIFSNNTNVVSTKAANEKVLGMELGYAYNTPSVVIRANGFYTQWKDRAMPPQTVTSTTIDPNTGQLNVSTSYVNIEGANQLHLGGELETVFRIYRKLTLQINASYINAKYTNDVAAVVYPENDPTKITKIFVYADGLYVSEFPQQQASVQLNYSFNIMSGLTMYVNPVFKYYGRFYSYFDPDKRTVATDREQPWQIPDYNITDFHFGFTFYATDFLFKKLNLNFHVFNFFNNPDYITSATDGSVANTFGPAHSAVNSKVFYGRERWYNVGVALTF